MKINEYLKALFKNKKIKDTYCVFNKNLFKETSKYKKKGEILIEFNNYQPNHAGLAIISNILSKKFRVKINAYTGYSLLVTPLKYTFFNYIKWLLGNFFNLGAFKIYRSFNTKKIFKPSISKLTEIKSEKLFHDLWNNIKKKEDVINIKVSGIHFGDLIYDTYIKSTYKPTINIHDPHFKVFFKDFIKLILFWLSYFKENDIKAIIGSHSVYSFGLPLRIAAKKNIPAYVLDVHHLFKITKKRPYQLSDSQDYKKTASNLFKEGLSKGKILAKKQLKNRFAGNEVVDLALSKSAYHNYFKKRLIKKTNKIKVLICAHEFFDAVSIYGKNLFPDFYEWLEYLGRLSNETSYDWYIKGHPKQPGKFKKYQLHTEKILRDFVKKYKNIRLLPKSYSHQQILKENIDYALTVYGSIAFEYPFFNIPVINASKNHPSKKYNFSITPNSIKQYDNILKNLKKINYKINKDEIYEYYFIRFIHSTSTNWLLNYNKLIKKFKYWSNIYSVYFYKYYMDQFNKEDFDKKMMCYIAFLKSKNHRIKDIDLIK